MLNGREPLEGTNITMEIARGEVRGFAGCNWYTWYPAVPLNDPSNFELTVTLQKCVEPEGVMEQEEAYIEALRTAEVFRVESDLLEFFNSSDEQTLSFMKE